MSNLTYEQLVERVAKAISEAPFPSKSSLATARAAIAVIAEETKEPTEAMMEAVECVGDKKDWLSGRAWKSGYRSMHAASPLYPEGK